jgi:hypothetical protein
MSLRRSAPCLFEPDDTFSHAEISPRRAVAALVGGKKRVTSRMRSSGRWGSPNEVQSHKTRVGDHRRGAHRCDSSGRAWNMVSGREVLRVRSSRSLTKASGLAPTQGQKARCQKLKSKFVPRSERFAKRCSVSRSYELRTLVCPQCKSVLKFVCERPVKSHQRIAWSEFGLKAKGK